MKVAIVHDYLKEYGGAERVLEALSEIWPDAPIYTSFYTKGSAAHERFKNKDIRVSWAHYIPFFASKLHSPLRFLAPLIWGSFDFSEYDVVISSASWYVTKGFGRRDPSCHAELVSASQDSRTKILKQVQDDIKKRPIEVCYCHTPPRWLYGYKTSVEWQKYWPVQVYATIVGHFMRLYDFNAAQKVDYFIANSKEVAARIKKFYRRDATVIYPPVSITTAGFQSLGVLPDLHPIDARSSFAAPSAGADELRVNGSPSGRSPLARDYYFIVSRLVGGKGLDLAVKAAIQEGFKLKIAGAPAGYATEYKKLIGKAPQNVEFLGRVSDEELVQLYAGAKAFLALAQDEDFGITPVEAMMCGTPVVAFRGGGYLESVVDGKTGVFFNESNVESLIKAIKQLNKLKISSADCIKQAQKFSKERFKREILSFLDSHGFKTDSH